MADRCGRILSALFDAWFDQNPGHIPFKGDERITLDMHSLDKLVKQAPQVFLQGITAALIRTVDMVIAEGESGNCWYDLNYRSIVTIQL